MELTNTPRPAGKIGLKGEPISGKPLTVANGWIDRPSQTKGMSVLYIDQVLHLPDAQVSAQGLQSNIARSRYAPYTHVRNAWWLYRDWMPVRRFINTEMDMRFQVGKVAPFSNEQRGNLPGGVQMGPYYAPFRGAWLVPRFSTEPYTVIPQPAPGSTP